MGGRLPRPPAGTASRYRSVLGVSFYVLYHHPLPQSENKVVLHLRCSGATNLHLSCSRVKCVLHFTKREQLKNSCSYVTPEMFANKFLFLRLPVLSRVWFFIQSPIPAYSKNNLGTNSNWETTWEQNSNR